MHTLHPKGCSFEPIKVGQASQARIVQTEPLDLATAELERQALEESNLEAVLVGAGDDAAALENLCTHGPAEATVSAALLGQKRLPPKTEWTQA